MQEGKLAMNLIRPVDFQMVMIADAAGQSAFRAILFTVPISVVLALIFPAQAPGVGRRPELLFLLSAAMSFFLVAGLNFLVGLVAIRSKSILGLLRAKYLVVESCSWKRTFHSSFCGVTTAVAVPAFQSAGTCGASDFGGTGGESGVAPGGALLAGTKTDNTTASDATRERRFMGNGDDSQTQPRTTRHRGDKAERRFATAEGGQPKRPASNIRVHIHARPPGG